MVIGNPDAVAATNAGGGANSLAHPSGIPQDKIDNIMSGIANTGDVKMNNHRKKLRQRFDIIKKLGQGTYGKVQLGINKETGQEVAIKTIKKCKIEAEADLVRIRREVQIMSSVQHPNIIHIYEVFENREKMVLVMEFAAGGELYDYLSERKVLSEEEARRIFRQVATACYYCHKHKICHRDLKLENILLDEQGNAKIADFGLSNVFDDQRLLATFCGSPLYASPEIVEGTPYQGPEVDCWSLGVLLYTLVYGSMPFDGSNFKRLVKQISQGDYYEPKKPSRASSLIRDMLTVCPRKRATIEQICSHWWVNENDNVSCLDLAEDLANQTPVRLDVLLSLTPATITADQMVVPSADGSAASKGNERVPRSHSVGSIRDMGANTEAERRILDMVAAGGEAALMPSPTRTITPAQSPIQSKRKLETTVSMENAIGAVKKKEKAASSSLHIAETAAPLSEEIPMETDEAEIVVPAPPTPAVKKAPSISSTFSQKDMKIVGDLCEKLMQDTAPTAAATTTKTTADNTNLTAAPTPTALPRQKTVGKLDAVEEAPEEKDATKVIKKFVNKHKTADLVNAIGQIQPDKTTASGGEQSAKTTTSAATATTPAAAPFVRKCSLQDETTLNQFNAEHARRQKSRILETAEKFAQMNASNGGDKPKKLIIPGVSVGSFKKEFEKKASITPAQGPTAGERRALEQVAAAAAAAQESESAPTPPASPTTSGPGSETIEASDSKNSVSSLSLDDARRSMENSIALLRQAQTESSKEVDQLCAKTESIGVNDTPAEPFTTAAERERKLKNARAIIGNAIQPVIRRPQAQPPSPPFFGIGGGGYGQMRAASGGYIGFGGGGYKNLNNNNIINSAFFTNIPPSTPPPQQPQPYSLPYLTPPLLTPNANVALAAARQNIMGRLAAGGHHSNVFHSPNSIQSTAPFFMQSSNLRNSKSSPPQRLQQHQVKQLQPQPQTQKQLQLLQQQLQLLQQQKRLHHMSMPSCSTTTTSPSSYAASAFVATAANATTTTTATTNSVPKPFYNAPPPSILVKSSPGGDPSTVKTSTATITLKSATLPRRKTAKTEIQLEIKPRIAEQPQPAMRFTTEMQHPVADVRSAPPREGPVPYSPIKTILNARATSLEPKEHIIPIQRQQAAYARTSSNTTTRSGSLSRQSTNDSESDTTTTNMSQSTITGSSQPIKKSPREFIIPIAMEGGGFITPREGSIEPSESSHTTSSRSTFSRLKPTRRIGSLLNDSGIDDGVSPFPKMRTASANRDADDDGGARFALHKLRSSRPVKKISQDNDSQSSGEEDDDDGFEILTAENLFSTLLQRVRALTNRLNVNNDITTGFPNSSRLLSNMRQGHSPFWNQEPFGRSQVSYFYSQTVEKKHVRLNNAASGNNIGVGAPWRHSMSRDLGSDMDSIFSRTGATLPRGNKTSKTNHTSTLDASSIKCATDDIDGYKQKADTAALTDELPLDLADLDLSRLRLSKKDLETLSSITPGLPKCFQEQLLAKLPPTQARKLSRTLSMQNSPQISTVKIYKRSQSGGRGVVHEAPPAAPPPLLTHDLKENVAEEMAEATTSVVNKNVHESSHERFSRGSYNPVYRRSTSRSRYDYESSIPSPMADTIATKSRSSSVCRDDYSKSLCSSYTSDINDKYKYYSPYLSKSIKDSSTESGGSVSPHKRFGSVSPRDSSTSALSLGRPPSGCLSPPPIISADGGSSSLRRRSTQRRISRFLRPDFFDEPLVENPYQREKQLRERETQSVLREIREKSREPSRDRLSQSNFDCDDLLRRRKHSLPSDESDMTQTLNSRHLRNNSMESYSELDGNDSLPQQDAAKRHRRSLSRSRELSEEIDKHDLADKILQELQLLSAVRTQRLLVPKETSVERTAELVSKSVIDSKENDLQTEEPYKEKTATIRKVKKIKPKEKSTESSTDADYKITTTVVKKVKKIVKKCETTKTPTTETALNIPNTDAESLMPNVDCGDQAKRESKLKRPKSYPTKEIVPGVSKSEIATISVLPAKLPPKPTAILESSAEPTNSTISNTSVLGATRESRLMRPKSYPASKLTPPTKDAKKTNRSGIAIPSIAETNTTTTSKSGSISGQSTSEEKSISVTPTGKSSIDTSSSSESRPTTIKKIIKVTKKSKLAQPTPITPTTPTQATIITGEDSKELIPATTKEKSPEKKPGKGLFYAIGQKFEKLRDSAMNKDKKIAALNSTMVTTNSLTSKFSPDNSSPEKIKERSLLLRKKKSLDSSITKTDKPATRNEITAKTPNTSNVASEVEKSGKTDKRSRIDAMIRSLRERSLPRSHTTSESHYIKRAVSVEEMPGTFNRNAVNKVLGLFKRFDKDGGERRVQNTRSTSNIERQIRKSSLSSPIYQNTTKVEMNSKPTDDAVAVHKSELPREASCNCEVPKAKTQDTSCPECLQDQAAANVVTKRRDETTKSNDITTNQLKELYQGNKDKRKGLMLDLKLDKMENNTSTIGRNTKTAYINGNGLYSNLPPYPGTINNGSSNNSSSQQSMDNATNNNNNNNNNSCATNNNSSMHTSQTSGYRTSSAHEINRNHLLTPSNENIANYSSDSRSYQDDCASTSTFLSPTDEPELYFDNWSVCSEDNYMLHASPSPTVSRLSRASQLSSPTRCESSDPNESVIDRIKRRSFYTRFNDKKPKRTSSIVGPSAVRDYYREQQAAVKARSNNKLNNERASSPDITQEFFRPLKLSPVGTELKPPIYHKSHLDYSSATVKPRKSLNDIRPSASPSLHSAKRYGGSTMTDNDYLSLSSALPTARYKSSSSTSPYEINGGTAIGGTNSYYSTYNPKRRSSYTLNGTLPSGGSSNITSSHIDGYATVGRRSTRPYDQRTLSLLDPASAGTSSYRRETRTPVRDYTSSISRSNSRYRASSTSRSPTNI